MVVQVGGNTYERPGYTRAWHVEQPTPAITGQLDRALIGRPLLEGEGFAVANYGGRGDRHVRDATSEPLGTLTAGGSIGLTQHSVLRVPRDAVLSATTAARPAATPASRPARSRATTGTGRRTLRSPTILSARLAGTTFRPTPTYTTLRV